ncbi:MAG TPA: FG-GAP repeat protein [Dehalococcoidia bacterium]|nr:FG-GAP repeat protein [Dehalococcoidia bacterium]
MAGALCATLVLAACGGGGGQSQTSVTPGGTSPSTAAATPAANSNQGLPAQKVIDLAKDKPVTVIEGADTGDFFNDLPAMAIGDVNGDGLPDLLAGARFGDGPNNSRQDSGEAYIIFGRKQWPASLDLAAGQQDVTIYGARSGDNLGWFGLTADVNNDGTADIVISGALAQRPDSGLAAGVVYVFFGKPGLPHVIDLATDNADLTVLGPNGSALFGDSMAAADVNGDGLTDLIIGSTFAARPEGLPRAGQQAGAAYVIYGSRTIGGTRDMAHGDYDVAVFGAKDQPHSDEVGNHVAAGDLNGDGVDDIVIDGEAANGKDDSRSVAGNVYIVYGSKSLKKVIDLGQDEQDAVFWGAETNDTLGFNLRVADVTGDRAPDLLMTARLAGGPGDRVNQAGEVHIVPGPSIPKTTDLADDPADTYLYGHSSADSLGYGLGALDIDGDGINELYTSTSYVASGPGRDRQGAGEAYVLDARPLKGATDILVSPLKLVIYGANAGDGLGAAMSAGDLDGDGKPELAILAVRSNGPGGSRPQAGEIYILKP